MNANKYVTKKKGKTEVYPFWNLEDINKMINYFKDNDDWDNYLIFMLGLLLGRRIGDTIMVKWSDFYYENGNQKEEINTIEEQKTGKFTNLPISRYVFECINLYISKTKINPSEHYDECIFSHPSKTEWINRKGNVAYSNNDIEEWCEYLHKDISEKRKEKIMSDFQKQKEYTNLGEYLYEVVEKSDVIKWETDAFRKEFKKAAEYVGIKYRVSCHSLRKTFGYWSKLIHPNDPNALETLQDIFNHTDSSITLKYIGLSEKRKQKYFNDFGDMIRDVEDGKTDIKINNSPIVSLTYENLRGVIMYCIKNRGADLDVLNQAIKMIDDVKITNI